MSTGLKEGRKFTKPTAEQKSQPEQRSHGGNVPGLADNRKEASIAGVE